MCTGVEIALIAGTALSAGAAIYQGQTEKKTADVNAELQNRQAAADQDAAVAQAEKIRKAAQRQAGEANASLAASGVSIGEGTPVAINDQIYTNSEQDAYSVLLTGKRKSASDQAQAGIDKWQGNAAQTGSLLSAGATIASGWYGYKTAGQKKAG